MKRRLLPALVLFTLSLAFQVRPRFMEDCPEVSDAKLGLRIPVALVLQTVTECRLRELPHVLVFDNSDLEHPFRKVTEYEGGRNAEAHRPLPRWLPG